MQSYYFEQLDRCGREAYHAMAAGIEALSEAGREKFVHDFICENVRYDKLKKPYSHEVIGPLIHGVGVCEGMAKTVCLLCRRLGLPCVTVISENAPERGIRYRHAWNIVRINGNPFHLDATFDGTLSRACGCPRYDYFNLGDAAVFRDHEALVYPAPPCPDNTRFYYREQRLSLTCLEDVQKHAGQAARKGRPLVFHWRGGPLSPESCAAVVQALEAAARGRSRHVRASLNRAQAVFCADFPEQAPAAGLCDEQANEGEADII